jgi:hypothetical protein
MEIQDIVNKFGVDYLKSRQRADLKKRRILKMSSDDEYIPNALRFAFELKVCDDAKQDAGFTTLVNESNDIIAQCKKDLKEKIVSAAQIELTMLKRQAAESLSLGHFALTQAFFVASGRSDQDPHKIINTLLNRQHETILTHLDESLSDFRTIYKVRNKVAVLPQPFVAPGNTVARRNPPNSQPSDLLTQSGSQVTTPYLSQPPYEPAPPTAATCLHCIHKLRRPTAALLVLSMPSSFDHGTSFSMPPSRMLVVLP